MSLSLYLSISPSLPVYFYLYISVSFFVLFLYLSLSLPHPFPEGFQPNTSFSQQRQGILGEASFELSFETWPYKGLEPNFQKGLLATWTWTWNIGLRHSSLTLLFHSCGRESWVKLLLSSSSNLALEAWSLPFKKSSGLLGFGIGHWQPA